MLLFITFITTAMTLIGVLAIILKLLPRTTRRRQAILLDTSALIDGRIIEVVKSGFVPAQLLVPRFVIAELQLLADKSDHLKRERARYGLSVIQDLQASRNVEVAIISDDIKSESGVDEKLVRLALKRGAQLFTTDFNLLKVAEIEGIRVLNINELAQNLRPTRLPGEQTELKIVQKGQGRDQGIGYLEDGTLVVVEKAKKLLDQTVRVSFTRNLQTTAGRMMFAELVQQKQVEPHSKTSQPKVKRQLKAKQRPAVKRGRRPQTTEDKLLNAIERQ